MRSLFFSRAGAHMCHATQLKGGWVGMMMFLALAHMCDATQLMGGGGGDDDVPCTCTHV